MHRELLGASLPHSTAGWCFAFIAILGGLSVFLLAVEKFVELFSGKRLPIDPLGGLALPAGWIIWGAAMIYWKLDLTTALTVLVGLAVIVAIRVIAARL